MESPLIWGWALLALAAVLLLAEFFIPTGGALGLAALAAATAGVVVLWVGAGRTWGLIGLLTVLVMGPAALAYGLKIWPHTPLGRRVLGTPSEEEESARLAAEEAARREADKILGKEGRVLSDLRPVGTVEVEGRRYDAMSETLFVPAGARVVVTGRDVAQIKVRPVA
jgi:membrane-bound ClpP family serine protease